MSIIIKQKIDNNNVKDFKFTWRKIPIIYF